MTEERVRAIRGATTVEADTTEAITVRVQELLTELQRRNELEHDDIISVFFTATPTSRPCFRRPPLVKLDSVTYL